jgi:hypothetical protein
VGKQEALRQITAARLEPAELGGALDALGDDLEIERLVEFDDGLRQLALLAVPADAIDERFVDLETLAAAVSGSRRRS